MTTPVTPPDLDAIWQGLAADDIRNLLRPDDESIRAGNAGYLNWEDFRLQFAVEAEDGEEAEGIDEKAAQEAWMILKLGRRQQYRALPFVDVFGRAFQYSVPAEAVELLHLIERDTASAPRAFESLTSTQTKTTYLRKSLVEEAIRSSQLEGTVTTRRAAKDLIHAGKEPVQAGERRIFNNYQALQQVRDWTDEPITPARVLELHAIITRGTLEDATASGRIRTDDEQVEVVDDSGEVLHEPPDAVELDERLQTLCDFANGDGDEFVHPVIRAMLAHFALVHDRPFVDGNGRVARALFYWTMARGGYRLAQYASISRVLRKSRAQQTRAFLDTINDDNDATYFVLYQLNVLSKAITELHEYLERKSAEIKDIAERIEHDATVESDLNKRQLDLIANALKEPSAIYTIESHKRTHGTAYATSRADLLELAELGLLDHQKRGRHFVFVPVPELRSKLQNK